MQTDFGEEWRRLAEHYRSMSDEELRELARDFADLTETAQQVMQQEMRSRGLGDPEGPESAPGRQPTRKDPAHALLALRNAPCDGGTTAAYDASEVPELVPDTHETHDEAEGPHEYTWKTPLCECETTEQAQQLSEALQLAGIDSWVEHPGSTYRYRSSALEYPRVVVAADQLDRAREIAAKPIPPEIANESKEEVLEFVEPRCPKCGSDDVVLERVDRENHWRCEECETEWSDAVEGGDGGPGSTGVSGA
jgi:hypothetical protein